MGAWQGTKKRFNRWMTELKEKGLITCPKLEKLLEKNMKGK